MENIEKSKRKLPQILSIEEIKRKPTQIVIVEENKRSPAHFPSVFEKNRNLTQDVILEENKRKLTTNLEREEYFPESLDEEQILTEHETIQLSLLDLLYELWNPVFPATRNLRLILGSISKYMVNHRLINPTPHRMEEGCSLKTTIIQLHGLCLKKGQINPKCSIEDMHLFIRHEVPPWLYNKIVKGEMSEETFDEWVKYHKEYIANLPGSSQAASIICETPAIEIDGEKRVKRGLDTLFDSTLEHSNECISQHIVKLDNGRLFSLKTPGEVGCQVIRIFLYDLKDISHKDCRNWWKYAKVRTQFLSSPNDRKQQLLRQLLDQAADDLNKIPGSIKEVKNLGDGSLQ